MTVLLYIAAGIISLLSLALIAGLILPRERVVRCRGNFDVPPEELFRIVSDNTDWQYRSDIERLVILESNDGMDVWEETAKNGNVLRFRTKEKRSPSFYSFDMEGALFSGHWTGEFEPDGRGGTLFTATEYMRVKNPFVKVLAYLFFDVGRLMEEYQKDLRRRIEAGHLK